MIGYARVSTIEQDPMLQEEALQAAGCQHLFIDRASGALTQRPELDAALTYLRPGDTLVVWRLDRLGRSLRHLLQVVADLGDRAVAFRSLHDNIDTTTATGRLCLHIFAALAEFERDLIRERTQAGLAAGDLITALNGQATPSTDKLNEILAGLKPGDHVSLSVTRADGSSATLKVTLGQLPG